MGRRVAILCLLTVSVVLLSFTGPWGFYGHRLINRVAVFSLPHPLFSFYKKNITAIQEISTAPDKRRYASPVEAVRHYMDLDHWKEYDTEMLRLPLADVILYLGDIIVDGDTIHRGLVDRGEFTDWAVDHYLPMRDTIAAHIYEVIIDGQIRLDTDGRDVVVIDHLTEHGIVPYHLAWYQRRLTQAMRDQDIGNVVRLSAEMGHYIADAHVPLHTTKNYNGQLTGQDGIHAFWETRLPELFAEAEYDFFVEEASYIDNVDSFFWEIVLESHTMVDDVLSIERELRDTYAADAQYCYEIRGKQRLRVPCREYSAEYQRRMKGMVEQRMQSAISSVASSWYTAWIDAGRPLFYGLVELTEEDLQQDSIITGDHIRRNN